MIKTIDDQIAAMAARWPQFNVVTREVDHAEWRGVLAPDKREHELKIRYTAPRIPLNFTVMDIQPRVEVVRPSLEFHHDYELGPLPHVYWSTKDRNQAYLCLFNPLGGEWGANDLIAHTTVYWANEWLYFYEGWLVTKTWRGGGVHIATQSQAKGSGEFAKAV